MREHVNGVPLPRGWRNLPLEDLIALADQVGAVYWIDEEALAEQVRQAIRDAATVAHYRPRHRFTAQATPATEIRLMKATEMRDAGIPWTKIAADLGFASDASACGSVRAYCERIGRDFPKPPLALRAPSRARGEKAYLLRMEGKRWRVVAEETGYSNATSAYAAVQRYCDMMGLEFPRPSIYGSPSGATVVKPCSLSMV